MRLNEPLWAFCRQFRADGGRVWIVSTGSRANIDNVMRHLGIGGPAAEGEVSGRDSRSAGTYPGGLRTRLPLRRNGPRSPARPGRRHSLGRRRGASETRSGLLSGGHAPRGMHAARDADLRGFADRHRGGTPQRSVVFRGKTLLKRDNRALRPRKFMYFFPQKVPKTPRQIPPPTLDCLTLAPGDYSRVCKQTVPSARAFSQSIV